MALANELQGDGTVHGHGFVAFNNIYQHGTLQDVADLIESRCQNLSEQDIVERITAFIEHISREDHFNDAKHQADLTKLEKEFHQNNDGPKSSNDNR